MSLAENERNIEANKEEIRFNRHLLIFVIIALIIFIVLVAFKQHSCEDRLYHKIKNEGYKVDKKYTKSYSHRQERV